MSNIIDSNKIQKAIQDLLLAIGENPNREGLKKTPERVAKMYLEILSSPKINYTTFDKEEYDGIVMLKNIEFCSTCEHHLMPFCGVANIAYIPNKKIIGISKLARIVEKYAHRLQIQEKMTKQIIDDIKINLDTNDVAVYIEAKHMCMIARGVKKQSSVTITSKLSGVFETENKKRDFYYMLTKK